MKNIVVVDVGNTSTCIGLACDGRISRRSRMDTGSNSREKIAGAIKRLVQKKNIHGSALCSVVPLAIPVWKGQLRKMLGENPLVVSHKLKLGFKLSYPEPASIGCDRLANACAAFYKYGAPLIVMDFGTALTFDVVSAKGEYLGGVICPGLPLLTDYMADKTDLLPRIRVEGQYGGIGRSTVEAMRIGARIGYRGMVMEIIKHLQKNAGLKRAGLYATGGYAKLAVAGLNMPIKVDPDLTLFGLSRIYDLNVR